MRRRWPILAGTVPLVLGWTLVAAHPAAAAAGTAGTIQPGGPLSPASGTTSPAPSSSPSSATSGVSPQVIAGGKTEAGNQPMQQQSLNWAGYAATSSTPFTGVTASWTQPTATCTNDNQNAAFWAGLDGYDNSTVEQTGTEVDCSSGTPKYSPWYEFYPNGQAMTWPGDTVQPGDQLTATVTYAVATGFTVTLKDTPQAGTGWTATETSAQGAASAARSSAEVIAEAPTVNGEIAPLTNFGSVDFTGAATTTATTGTAPSTSLDSLNPVEITMPDTTVSPLSTQDSFTVTYNNASTGGGGTGGRGGQGGGRGGGRGGFGDGGRGGFGDGGRGGFGDGRGGFLGLF